MKDLLSFDVPLMVFFIMDGTVEDFNGVISQRIKFGSIPFQHRTTPTQQSVSITKEEITQETLKRENKICHKTLAAV